MNSDTRGAGLEARVQRLFLAQGILAERYLKVIVDRAREKTATDIDVLISEYASGFHLTRRHAECKGGVKVHPLDRILWMRGVRHLLTADASYFIADEDDAEVAFFARQLEVDLWTMRHLEQMEGALRIDRAVWPARSDLRFDAARSAWLNEGKAEPGSSWWSFFREALRFLEQDSWMNASYTRLNRLFRLMEEVAKFHRQGDIRGDEALRSSRYLVSGLLVRGSQHLIQVCYDVSVLQRTDLEEYLYDRLVFGDHNSSHSRELVEGGVRFALASVEGQGSRVPAIDASRLMLPPKWGGAFLALILKLLDNSNEARYMPIAVEALQFDQESSTKLFPRLSSAMKAGTGLAALFKGFLIQALGLPTEVLEPIPASALAEGNEKTIQTGQLGLAVDGAEPDAKKLKMRRSGRL